MNDLPTAAREALVLLDGVRCTPATPSLLPNLLDCINHLRAAIEAAEKQEPIVWQALNNLGEPVTGWNDGKPGPSATMDAEQYGITFRYAYSTPTIPPGYRLIAREPTPEQINAAQDIGLFAQYAPAIFHAWWDAAPEVKL